MQRLKNTGFAPTSCSRSALYLIIIIIIIIIIIMLYSAGTYDIKNEKKLMLRCTEGLKAKPAANVQILYLLQNKITKTQGDRKFRTFVTWT